MYINIKVSYRNIWRNCPVQRAALMVNHDGQLVILHCHLTGHAFFSVGPAGSIDILKKKKNC